jgi:hypothetical protein
MQTIYGGASLDNIYYLLVAGDRNWLDYPLVFDRVKDINDQCQEVRRETHVVSGWARGADEFGIAAAKVLQIPCHCWPAPWERLGKAAGPERNLVMIERQPLSGALLFHDDIGSSRGTKNMMNILIKHSIEFDIVTHDR